MKATAAHRLLDTSTTLALIGAVVLGIVLGVAARRRLLGAAAADRLRVTTALCEGSSLVRRVGDVLTKRRSARVGRRIEAAAVAELLDRTARHCSSGESLGQSLTAALCRSPLAGVFAPTVGALRCGDAISDALARQPIDHGDVALAVHVLQLCASHGGNISESLDRAAATLRERDAVARERYAQSAQARMSARVLTVLPIGFGAWTTLTTPAVRQFFLTAIGCASLVFGLALNLGGWWLMNRVVRGTR